MISLKNLHEATAQQVFDQVVGHLRAQGQRSSISGYSSTGTCLYRHPEGLKCAAGCLIAEDEYKESFEGSTWIGVIEDLIDSGVPRGVSTHIGLISRLQEIHDTCEISSWENCFMNTAKEFRLLVPLE